MPVSWDLKEFDKMIATIDSIPARLQRALMATAEESSKRLLQLIQEKAPKKEGDYARSWSIKEITITGFHVVAILESPKGLLFSMLEIFGRKPSRIKKRKARAMHFEVRGVDVFTAWVNHPGFKAKPHVRPALDQIEQELPGIIKTNFDKEFPGLFTWS